MKHLGGGLAPTCFEKSTQTTGITVVTINTRQRNIKNDTRGKFSSSSRPFIMNGRGYYYKPAQLQGFQVFTLKDSPMLTYEFP